MQQFTVNPNRYNEIKKQMLYRPIPILVLVIIGVAVMNSGGPAQIKTDLTWLFLLIPFAVLSLRKGLKRQKTLLDSYVLTVSDNSLTRVQANTPTILIHFDDIRSIAKYKNGTFIIRSKDSANQIIVPAQIDNYEEFESIIHGISPVTTENSQPQLQKYNGLLTLLNLACMVCVYVSNNKLLVGICGTVFIAVMGWSFYKAWKSKNIDAKTKRSLLWMILVLLSVIGITIMKITGIGKP